MPLHPHPTPWRITDTGSAFRVADANGRALAYVYYSRTDAMRGDYLTPDEARALAQEIARLSRRQ